MNRSALELIIQSFAEKNVYNLQGMGLEPLVQEHIVVHCELLEPEYKTLTIPNVVGGGTVNYRVYSTLDCLHGEVRNSSDFPGCFTDYCC